MAIKGPTMVNSYEQLVIYNAHIDLNVIYCSTDADDVDAFYAEYEHLPRNQYVAKVLETFIHNWHNRILPVLKNLDPSDAHAGVEQLYNGCVMLNPALDTERWDEIVSANRSLKTRPSKPINEVITPTKFSGLANYLKEQVIGQDEVVDRLCDSLKRSVAGLSDENRPLGVFLFAGLSGSGKTHLASTLHDYLFGEEGKMTRIDCGEYQHKHENQKLIGSPSGYVGHEEGGHLTNQLKANPNTVVLFDEVEKAHVDIWHTLLRAFDEGKITDNAGNEHSLVNTIVIMTTNLGMKKTLSTLEPGRLGFGAGGTGIDDGIVPTRDAMGRNVHDACQDHFMPEFLNRIDEILVFNPLGPAEIEKIAELELSEVDRKLSRQGVSLLYNKNVVTALARTGQHTAEGARRVARSRRNMVEGVISDAILASRNITKGSVVDLTYNDDDGYQAKLRKANKKQE